MRLERGWRFSQICRPRYDAVRRASIAIETYGDSLNFNPYLLRHRHRRLQTSPEACEKRREQTISNRRSRRRTAIQTVPSKPCRLIPKIYKADPLCCPNCKHQIRIISIRESEPTVKKILDPDLWDVRNHDPPFEKDSHIHEFVYDDSDSQIPQYDYFD